ncbi:hypothetical protein Q8A73_007252 [Channa argus]|nr:hypothetical protein Q8A73_007252 [Channa argus]
MSSFRVTAAVFLLRLKEVSDKRKRLVGCWAESEEKQRKEKKLPILLPLPLLHGSKDRDTETQRQTGGQLEGRQTAEHTRTDSRGGWAGGAAVGSALLTGTELQDERSAAGPPEHREYTHTHTEQQHARARMHDRRRKRAPLYPKHRVWVRVWVCSVNRRRELMLISCQSLSY